MPNKLPNEMDDQARYACVPFVLTTNRPEMLDIPYKYDYHT